MSVTDDLYVTAIILIAVACLTISVLSNVIAGMAYPGSSGRLLQPGPVTAMLYADLAFLAAYVAYRLLFA